jgi:hypothetical protein
MSKIPKIIHQLWIGNQAHQPSTLMDTWRDKNPSFEYIRWTEDEIVKRKMELTCQNRINEIPEINGKADIIRWEILYKYGGVFLDADSICISPIDDVLMECKCFAGYEHEKLRKGLIATGTMGFPPQHPLVKEAIEWIKANNVSRQAAWITVGPKLLTRMYDTGKYKDMTVFPSYTFLPIHYTKTEYKGYGKIYAYQEWGSTKKSYATMNNVQLPKQFLTPDKRVSILVSSYNTKPQYVRECLESIKSQDTLFDIDLVWINDGSSDANTKELTQILHDFERTTRFITVNYSENDGNKGIGFTLNHGILKCKHEIIIKMDSDDIMVPNRINKQYTYMLSHSTTKICGGQIQMFKDPMKLMTRTKHPSITWDQFKKTKSHWFINHPTVCYRRQAVLDAGNYDDQLRTKDGDDDLSHDFELELRMLKKYGMIYNFPDVLLKYRLHDGQVTHKGGKSGSVFWNDMRLKLIDNFINDA